jgi:hypothetical protein
MSLEQEKGVRTRMTYYFMANIFVGIPALLSHHWELELMLWAI